MKRFLSLILLIQSYTISASPDSERYWVIFVFESTCTACVAIANQVHSFASRYDFEVKALSRDGKPLLTWESDWSPDRNGALWRLGVHPEDPTPQVFIMDSKTQKKYQVAYGYSNIDQMNEQFNMIKSNEK